MIFSVAAHDIEQDVPNNNGEKDFGLFQIEHSIDYTITGNQYLDSLLSGGAVPHMVHHVFPFQKSPFANIVSEETVKQEYERLGRKWVQPVNFWTMRLWPIVKVMITHPLLEYPTYSFWQEHFSWHIIWYHIKDILSGIYTIGPFDMS